MGGCRSKREKFKGKVVAKIEVPPEKDASFFRSTRCNVVVGRNLPVGTPAKKESLKGKGKEGREEKGTVGESVARGILRECCPKVLKGGTIGGRGDGRRKGNRNVAQVC